MKIYRKGFAAWAVFFLLFGTIGYATDEESDAIYGLVGALMIAAILAFFALKKPKAPAPQTERSRLDIAAGAVTKAAGTWPYKGLSSITYPDSELDTGSLIAMIEHDMQEIHLSFSNPVQIEAVGEYAHRREWLTVFDTLAAAENSEFEAVTGLLLIPEPSNSEDRTAVAVCFQNLVLGYMPSEKARAYFEPLLALGAPLYVKGGLHAVRKEDEITAQAWFHIGRPEEIHFS